MAIPTENRVSDLEWVKHTFLVSDIDLVRQDSINRIASDADFAFSDTALGGHEAINMPYQFTRYADLKTGLSYNTRAGQESQPLASLHYSLSPNPDDLLGDTIYRIYESGRNEQPGDKTAGFFGIGRYYHEAIETNSTLVHLRFGVPEYNSLFRFFGTFFNYRAASLANRGQTVTSFIFGKLGEMTGLIFALPFYPLILGTKIVRLAADIPSSKFYYLKPTMTLYRQGVMTILNTIAINMGVSPFSPEKIKEGVYSRTETEFTKEYLDYYHNLLPDVVNSNGMVDVFALTTRYTAKASFVRERMMEELASTGQQGENAISTIWKEIPTVLRDYMKFAREYSPQQHRTGKAHSDYLDSYMNLVEHKMEDSEAGSANVSLSMPEDAEATARAEGEGPNNEKLLPAHRGKYYEGADESKGFLASLWQNISSKATTQWEHLNWEMQDGGQFITFRVENPGSMSESFSNSTRESDLAQQVNSTSSSARNVRFTLGNGNLGGPIGKIYEAVESFVGGVADQFGASGLVALSGLAFVDIPKTWDSSTAQLPKADFTIQLRTPYGNRISQFFDLYVPMAYLLAGALPLSAGMQSFTSPFICECYSLNRCSIRLGMIESFSVTRAVNNLPFGTNRIANGIDISFSVVDMSSLVHMPLVTNRPGMLYTAATALTEAVLGQEAAQGVDKVAAALSTSTYSEDNAFNDYMAVLGGLNLTNQVYGTRKVALRNMYARAQMASSRTPAALAAAMRDNPFGRIISGAFRTSPVGQL